MLLFLFFLLTNYSLVNAQNKGYVIGVDKLFVDANDPLYKQVKPGDTIYFSAGSRKYINVSNFQGSAVQPIIMINSGGDVIIDTDHYYGITIQNCRYIKFTGSGSPGQFYGFKIKKVSKGAGLSMGYLSSDIEIDHISIENTLIGGLYAKTDPDCDPNTVRSAFTQFNTVIHDNYIANTGDEGMYVGSTKYFGQTVKCNGKDTLLMPSLLDGVKIYNNILKYTGWDGIQVSSASKNCQVFDNTILYDSQDNEDTQMSGILIGGGTKCDCYNNFISQGNGDGIECLGLGGTRIYNNIILDAGLSYFPNDQTKMKYGIYVNDTSVEKDSSFYLVHNNIIHPKSDGIRFSSTLSKGNFISSNVIINPGSYDYYENGNTSFKGKDSYIMFQSEASVATVSNNYAERDASSAGFVSLKMDSPPDFKLVKGSPLIDAVDYHAKTAVAFDFNYFPRPYGTKSDIGAWECDIPTSATPIPITAVDKQNWLLRNPVSDLLTICFKTVPDQESILEICNLQGVLERKIEVSKMVFGHQQIEVNVAGLPGGVYLYLLRSKKTSYSGKFIKR